MTIQVSEATAQNAMKAAIPLWPLCQVTRAPNAGKITKT